VDGSDLDRRVLTAFEGKQSQIKASKDQIQRIESLSKELTELCDMSSEAANQLIFHSIIKWQNETELNYEEGLIMTYTERLRHKSRMFEIGKDSISQLISSPEEIEKVSRYIDKKMYQYLSGLLEADESD